MFENIGFSGNRLILLDDLIPSEITDDIRELCNEISPGTNPVFILYKPEQFAQMYDCFPSVENKIKKDGGSCQYGWQIWKTGVLLIEAEFHAVWKSESGELIDITPKELNSQKILFLADNSRKYEGKQVKNIMKNISGNALIDDHIRIWEAIYYMENKDDRAYKHGLVLSRSELELKKELLQIDSYVLEMAEAGKTEDDLCFCGKGAKYKYCHRHQLNKLLNRILSLRRYNQTIV